MFVPVACLKCSKLFQVPEGAAGTEVPCPWCKAATLALPVAGVASPPSASGSQAVAESARSAPASPQAAPTEVLSLDEDPPAEAHPDVTPAASSKAPAARPPLRPRSRLKALALGSVLAIAACFLTFALLRYGTGRVPFFAWREFTAPDGSCRVDLPAAPDVSPVEPLEDFKMTRGGQRFAARDWYSKVAATLSWQDLDPERAKTMRPEDLAGGEFLRRRTELQATATGQEAVKRADREGIEYWYATPGGKVVDRMVVVGTGPRPRLYVLSYSAPALREKDQGLLRFLESFRTE